MAEDSAETPAQGINKSTNPQVQSQVDKQLKKLQSKNPNADINLLNQHARDRVAGKLWYQRKNKQFKEAQEEAMYDEKTGLHNGRWFEEELKRRVAEAKRTNKVLWIMEFDIDRFKDINSLYGHKEGGDKVIKLIRKLQTRIEEPICRTGGEEFDQILDENIKEEQIPRIIERYMRIFGDETEKLLPTLTLIKKQENEEERKRLTLSFGVTKYIPGESTEEFKIRVNLAMNYAKNNGRNTTFMTEVKNGIIEFKELPRIELGEEEERDLAYV